MKSWTRVPVVRLLLPFSLGISTGLYFDSFTATAGILLLSSGAIHVLFTVRRYATGKHATRWLAGIPAVTAWFSAGLVATGLHLGVADQPAGSRADAIVVLIKGHASWKEQSARTTGVIVMQHEAGKWKPDNLPVTVRFKNARKLNPEPGDLVLIRSGPVPVKGPMNPGQFDYRNYLRKKGIRHQVYSTGGDALMLEKQYQRTLINAALPLRNRAAAILEQALPDKEVLGITAALVLGEERWLDDQVEAGFSGAGVLHVLCVSGMHVVLLLSLIEKMLALIRIPLRFQWTRHLFLICFTWYYTSLTGFSPSIVRAAVMMTLLLAGKLLGKQGNLPNTLAGCAILMLVAAPGYLFDAGFQLSFLAIIGIVFIHEKLRWVVEPKSSVGVAVRDLVSVTIAAQAATFPLSLYYFGQFPNYFLFANLLIVPLSTWVLYAGMLILVAGWIPGLGDALIYATTWSVRLLNGITLEIASLPHAVSTDIYIDGFQFVLICLVVYGFYGVLQSGSFVRLAFLLVSLNIFVTTKIIQQFTAVQSRVLTVYHQQKGTLLSCFHGTAALLIGSETTATNTRFAAGGNLMRSGINSIKHESLSPGNLIAISKNDSLIICLNGSLNQEKIDWIFGMNPDLIIADGSVPNGTLEKLRSSGKCDDSLWSTRVSGAWTMTFNR
jgi:competence protein ComEC